MNSNPLVIAQHQQPPALNVVGMQVTVLADNASTGSYGITLQGGDEGTGPPPHRHDWDEAFYVLRGEVEFQCNGAATTCGQGALVHVPRGTLHAFSFRRGGGLMLEISGTGAQAAPFFTALDREMPPGPPDVPKLLEIADRYGVAFAEQQA